MRLIPLLLFLTFHQSFAQTLDFNVNEADMSISMPNAEWSLAQHKEGYYTFKRNGITDSEGRKIIPAIMVFIEDATEYKQDVTKYSLAKRLMFKGKEMTVDKIMIHENKDYPISYKNSYLTMCSYTDNGMAHILYMIHIISDENKGIQIYMDMTKSVAEKNSEEFWIAMRSIKEAK